ncbi:hypothetical protein F5879DRAFT_922989, partial [Lentinula edodes]
MDEEKKGTGHQKALSVLRMVKFFGWESLMGDRIKDAREEELVYVKKLRLLELASGLSNHVIPLVVMLVTYATYVDVASYALSILHLYYRSSSFAPILAYVNTLHSEQNTLQ